MSDQTDSPDVILLRSADPPDPYVRAFEDAGLQAVCVPVLSFVFPSDEALRDHLRDRDRYDGLIATSPRAGRALRRVLWNDDGLRAAWTGAQAYVVGPKTGAAFRALGFDVRGEEAGRADALASLIANDGPDGRLLFLAGNRRRDTLPDALRAAGQPFEELIVYETHTRSNLTLPDSPSGPWLVFFSPSGIEAIHQSGIDLPGPYHCAAIGPTTAEALQERGVPVAAAAETPSPDGLVEAIVETQKEGRRG